MSERLYLVRGPQVDPDASYRRPTAIQPEPLFEGYDPAPPPPSRDPDLSADRRRTLRQAEQIARGVHPLTGGPIHLLASLDATPDDGKHEPYRCGSCRFRQVLRYHNRRYPKCTRDLWHGDNDMAITDSPRISHSAATDVRAWWPACNGYEPGDTGLSPDAARSIP